jgi:hypothetical protein
LGTTLWRFLAGADLGRAKRTEALNRAMLRRAWAMGAGPGPGLITIDPDATYVDTYGPGKESSSFSYKGEVKMSPLVGVVGETGNVLAVRARGGKASPRRKLASFVDECVSAIPGPWRSSRQLWIRIDSAGYSRAVIDAAISHNAAFSITCVKDEKVRETIYALQVNPGTTWVPALGADGELFGSEIAETTYRFGERTLRMIVRRQRVHAGDQLSFEDLDGWRFHAIVTNVAPVLCDGPRSPPPPGPRWGARRGDPPAEGGLRSLSRPARELLRQLVLVARLRSFLQRRPMGAGPCPSRGVPDLSRKAPPALLFQRRGACHAKRAAPSPPPSSCLWVRERLHHRDQAITGASRLRLKRADTWQMTGGWRNLPSWRVGNGFGAETAGQRRYRRLTPRSYGWIPPFWATSNSSRRRGTSVCKIRI